MPAQRRRARRPLLPARPQPAFPLQPDRSVAQDRKGNREGKAPIRYLGRFFYSTGEVEVAVPAGIVTGRGLEGVRVSAGRENRRRSPPGKPKPVTRRDSNALSRWPRSATTRATSICTFPARTEADDQVILDLLEAEDIHFGSILAYNEPAGPYTRHDGVDGLAPAPRPGENLDHAPRRDLDRLRPGVSQHAPTVISISTGATTSCSTGQKVNANNWPLYGTLGRETRQQGGFAIHAHGGYAQAIYADFVQKNIDAVELLQFGVYRGIELADWYHILNIGYRFPCVGASDYPACRKLGDCQTYVYAGTRPRLRGLAQGRGPGAELCHDRAAALAGGRRRTAGRNHPQDAARGRIACRPRSARPARSRRSRPCRLDRQRQGRF